MNSKNKWRPYMFQQVTVHATTHVTIQGLKFEKLYIFLFEVVVTFGNMWKYGVNPCNGTVTCVVTCTVTCGNMSLFSILVCTLFCFVDVICNRHIYLSTIFGLSWLWAHQNAISQITNKIYEHFLDKSIL